MDEPDIASAAMSGVRKPAAASGTARDVVGGRKAKFCTISRLASAPIASAAVTGARRPPHEERVGRRLADMGGGHRRDRHMRGRERRRVVDPIAHHQHLAAPPLQRLDDGDLLGRGDAGSHSATPSASAT